MIDSGSLSIPSALLGQAVIFALFVLVVSVFLREAARILIRIGIVVGIILAVAVITGWLDDSVVGQILEALGDTLLVGLRAVVVWLRDAWEVVANAAGV
jgi:hypothetical protein